MPIRLLTVSAHRGKEAVTSGHSRGLLQRMCACGGAAGMTGECGTCSSKKLLGRPIQRKLAINQSGDLYEQEADRVAEQVMRMPDPHGSRAPGESAPPLVQRRAMGGGTGAAEAPPSVHDALVTPGRLLDASTRAFFEPRFGHDFSRVRVHTGSMAEASARDVDAQAYTVGHDIVFGAGRFAPESQAGRHLLAHELAHVVQQSVETGAPVPRAGEARGDSTGKSPTDVTTVGPSLQRQPVQQAEIEMPAEYAFALDKRKRTWRRYARSLGAADAVRIGRAGTLSSSDRAEINAKLAFFEGEAKEAYIQEIKPVLMEASRQPTATEPNSDRAAAVAEAEAVAGVTTEQLEAESDAEDALKLDWRRRKDKKYAWALGLKDKARLKKSSVLSPELQQEITVKLRFFRNEAKAAYLKTISPVLAEVAEGEQVIEILAEPAPKLTCDIGQNQVLLEYEGDPAASRCMNFRTDPEMKNFFDLRIRGAVGYAVEATTWENIEYDRFNVMLVKYRNGTSEYFMLDDIGNFYYGGKSLTIRDHSYLKRENGLVYPVQNNRILFSEALTPNIIAYKNGLKSQIKELQDLYVLLQVGGTFASIMGAYGAGAGTFKASINAFRRSGPAMLPGKPLPGRSTKPPAGSSGVPSGGSTTQKIEIFNVRDWGKHSYSNRRFGVVDTPDGAQAWYIRTGKGGAAGQGGPAKGDAARFHGWATLAEVNEHNGRTIPSGKRIQGWFIKPEGGRFGMPGTPEAEINKNVSDWLSTQTPAPSSNKIQNVAWGNNFLRTHGVPVGGGYKVGDRVVLNGVHYTVEAIP